MACGTSPSDTDCSSSVVSVDYSDDLQLAFDTSDLAADLALSHFVAGVSATLKADGTPVTEADRAVERLIVETLSAARPRDALLGEELGRHGESERVWIIDPIDGTKFFSRRDPNWRVHLVLEVAGTTEVAVVVAPAIGRCWWATRGGGTFESPWPRGTVKPVRLKVSSTSQLAGARIATLDAESVARLPSGPVPAPMTPLPLVELVRGEIDAFLVERYYIWDHAPWILLIQEAGGCFTDRTGGHSGDRGGGLYSNAGLHDQLIAALAYDPHREADTDS